MHTIDDNYSITIVQNFTQNMLIKNFSYSSIRIKLFEYTIEII